MSKIGNLALLLALSSNNDYEKMKNLPKINGKPVVGDKTSAELGIIDKTVDDLENYYTKTDVESKLAVVFRYKGSVQTYSELPSSGQIVGDVYNILEADTTHHIEAGDNVCWNGTEWDRLGGDVDLSNYLAKDNTTSYTPTSDYNPATKYYVDDNLTNYLSKTNTTSYTPSANYHPATKKYVDDSIADYPKALKLSTYTTSSSMSDSSIDNLLNVVSDGGSYIMVIDRAITKTDASGISVDIPKGIVATCTYDTTKEGIIGVKSDLKCRMSFLIKNVPYMLTARKKTTSVITTTTTYSFTLERIQDAVIYGWTGEYVESITTEIYKSILAKQDVTVVCTNNLEVTYTKATNDSGTATTATLSYKPTFRGYLRAGVPYLESYPYDVDLNTSAYYNNYYVKCYVTFTYDSSTSKVTNTTITHQFYVNPGSRNMVYPYNAKSYVTGAKYALTTANTTSYTPSANYHPATKKYVDDTVAGIDLSNYLAKNNTTSFTPSGNYNPATKKYVDDTAANYLSKTNTTSYTPSANYHPATKKYVDDTAANYLSKTNTTSYTPSASYHPATKKYVDDVTSKYTTMPVLGSSSTSLNGKVAQYIGTTDSSYTNGYFYKCRIETESGGLEFYAWDRVDVQPQTDLSNYLSKTNTTSYTPSNDYNPATKKYVDDAITSSAIQYSTMPTADSSNVGQIVQYTGNDATTYNPGYFYKSVEDGGVYSWEQINIQPDGSMTKLSAADYNYPTNEPDKIAAWLLPDGVYEVTTNPSIYLSTSFSVANATIVKATNSWGSPYALVISNGGYGTDVKSYALTNDGSSYSWKQVLDNSMVKDNLNTTAHGYALDAYQGKVLKDLINGRVAISSGAPTTSTEGTVGQLLTDIVNGKLYICTEVDPGSGVPSYTWVEVGTGGSTGGGDTLPIGAIVDYDGSTVPTGYIEVSDDNYSLLEQDTGKTWVDGKSIYRKVIYIDTFPTYTAPSSADGYGGMQEYNTGIVDMEIPVNMYGMYYDTSSTNPQASWPICNTYNFLGADRRIDTRLKNDGTKVTITYGNSNMSNYKGYIILEYTKTTDAPDIPSL